MHGMSTDYPTKGTAWDFIGYDGPAYLRIVGGSAKYEAAMYLDNTPGDRVKLARLEARGDGTLREISRYVDPDTLLEVVH
jgi:hypothetical protein